MKRFLLLIILIFILSCNKDADSNAATATYNTGESKNSSGTDTQEITQSEDSSSDNSDNHDSYILTISDDLLSISKSNSDTIIYSESVTEEDGVSEEIIAVSPNKRFIVLDQGTGPSIRVLIIIDLTNKGKFLSEYHSESPVSFDNKNILHFYTILEETGIDEKTGLSQVKVVETFFNNGTFSKGTQIIDAITQ